MGIAHSLDIFKAVATLRTATGEDIQNVFHYRYKGSDVADDVVCESILGAVDTMFSYLEPAIPADVAFINIDITNVTQQIFFGPFAWPSMDTGGGTGDTVPEQLCGLVVGTTNRSKTLGKKFLGPFIASSLSDGAWTSGILAALAQFATTYLEDWLVDVAGSIEPVLVHYVNNVLTYVTDIVGATVSNGVYTQRRRRRGVGI